MPKPLTFDPEFDKRKPADQIGYLKKLASSQNEALDMMQKERDELVQKLKVAQTQAASAEQAYYTQKEIVANLITQSNAENQGIAERIHELESRVRAQDELIEGLNGRKH